MKKLLVVYNACIKEDDFKNKNKLLIDTAKNMGYTIVFKCNTEIYTYLEHNKAKCYGSYETFDYAFFFDGDAILAKNLELLGVKVINNSASIKLCNNKADMYQLLVENGVNIPKTVMVPFLLNFEIDKLKEFINQTVSELNLPIVIKELEGQDGKGVYLAKTKQGVFDAIEKLKGKKLLLQEFIVEAAGSDIRVFVIKGKVITAIRRQGAQGDFRSNVSLGGRLSAYIPTVIDTEISIRAAKAMGCDFAIVDILKGISGSLVCEVNSTANINNFYECSHINIAELMLKAVRK